MMRLCTDLHLHTCYSDGDAHLREVLTYCDSLDIVSITDHNTLLGCMRLMRQFGNGFGRRCRLLPGVELRLPGLPDYLLYFPRSKTETFFAAQEWVEHIDSLDQEITVHVANGFLGEGDPLHIWMRLDRCATCNSGYFGTRQLAKTLVALEQDEREFVTQVSRVRAAKSDVFRKPPPELAGSVNELLSLATVDTVLARAKDWDAEIVLAHPIRELARANKDAWPLDEAAIRAGLERVLPWLAGGAVGCVEHIARQENGDWWKRRFSVTPERAHDALLSWATHLGLSISVGTDSHALNESTRGLCVQAVREAAEAWSSHAPHWLTVFGTRECDHDV